MTQRKTNDIGADSLANLRKICQENHIPIIRRDTEEYISSCLKKLKPKNILEVGSCVGYSAMFFAHQCPEAHIVSLDIDGYALSAAKYNLNKAGLSHRVTFINGDAAKILKRITGPFDLILIDGGKSHYIEFLENIRGIAKKGAVILSDDIGQRGMTGEEINLSEKAYRKHRTSAKKMNEYIEFLTNSLDFDTEFYQIGDGLAVSIYKQNG